jgi:hypothetical protein
LQPASINNAAAINPVLIVMLRYPHCYKHMDITGKYGFWQEKSRVALALTRPTVLLGKIIPAAA